MLEATIRREADQDWEDRDDPEAEAETGVRWKLLITGERTPSAELTMGIAEIAPGATLGLHHHAQAETYYITAGTGRMTIDGVEIKIGPGSAIYIPPNAQHTATCDSATPLEFIFTFPCDSFDEVIYHYDE